MDQIPADYYRDLREVEQHHWWHRGMQELTYRLLWSAAPADGRRRRLLDVGCGTGGFLRFALDRGLATEAAGIDPNAEAIAYAGRLVPEAELHVGEAASLPFADGSAELAVCNDVLQHVPEGDVRQSLAELHRVLLPGGCLVLRTNGARRARRARDDWRVYDRSTLVHAIEDAGFVVERCTYANTLLSAWGALRGRTPREPTRERHGIPRPSSTLATALGTSLLGAERTVVTRTPLSLPYGHTLVALALRPGEVAR